MVASVALKLDRSQSARAAPLTAGVYVPGRSSVIFPPRRSAPREHRPAHRGAPVARPQHAVRPARAARRKASHFLANCIFGLKLIAAVLGSALTTLAYLSYNGDAKRPQVATVEPAVGQSTLYRSQRDAERGTPSNYPRAVRTVIFTPPPGAQIARPTQPQMAALAPAARPDLLTRSTPPIGANPLAGKPLRYLIGGNSGQGGDGEVTMVSYSTNSPVRHGISIAYCNLFDEHNTGKYGPYLRTSDTAAQYGEGQIDPRGPGWEKNLREQFERRRKAGFEYVELDNPDAYGIKDVLGAIELAATYDLKVIAKNPGLLGRGAVTYVAHPNVHGIIVEKGAGGASDMDTLRRKAGKPDLPVWFVAYGSGRSWASSVAGAARNYRGMGVTYSSAGEYGNAIDVLVPGTATRSAELRH
jgi:hypothetical protein